MWLVCDVFGCAFDPLIDVGFLKILQLDVRLHRPLVYRMVVVGCFANPVAVENEPSVALVAFVSNAQPVSSCRDLSLAAINETGMNN